MSINLTLVVQMLVFAAFVWFTMKLVWPPLEQALADRQEKIADGLSAAERGQHELELAQHRISSELKQAKADAAEIVEKANKRAAQIVDLAKDDARDEAQKQAKIVKEQLAQEINSARDGLKKQVAGLAVMGAEKIIGREIDEKSNSELINKLIEKEI